MADTFRIKRRVTGLAGPPSTLANAELAFDEVGSTLYYGKGNNGSGVATSIIPIGGSGVFGATRQLYKSASAHPGGLYFNKPDGTLAMTVVQQVKISGLQIGEILHINGYTTVSCLANPGVPYGGWHDNTFTAAGIFMHRAEQDLWLVSPYAEVSGSTGQDIHDGSVFPFMDPYYNHDQTAMHEIVAGQEGDWWFSLVAWASSGSATGDSITKNEYIWCIPQQTGLQVLRLGIGGVGGAPAVDLSGVQPLDADLTAISSLTGTNVIYYRSGVDAWSAVNVGTGLTFSGGTLAATGGAGGTPGGPAIGFRAHKSATQMTTNGDWTLLTFPVEAYDQGGYYNPATSRWTPPSGMIHIDAAVYLSNLTSGNLTSLAIYKNGTMLEVGSAINSYTVEGNQISCDDVANGTDYYEVVVYALGGGPIVDADTVNTFFSGHVVSAQGPKGDTGDTGLAGPIAPSWALIPVGFRAAKSADQTGIVNNTPTKITFPVENYDQGGYYDTVLSRWTPPAGAVHIDGQAHASTVTASTPFFLSIYKNGVALKVGLEYVTTGHSTQAVQVSVDDVCNGTDYYELWITCTTASTASLTNTYLANYFSGHAIGGPKGDVGPAGPVAPSWSLVPTGFRANKTADQTGIASVTPTKLTFPSENYDQGSYYDTATSRWTPPAGLIHIDASVRIASGLTTATAIFVYLYKNGAEIRRTTSVTNGASGGHQASFDDVCNGTDYYELFFSGTTASTIVIEGVTALQSWWSGHSTGGPKGDVGPAGPSGSGSGDVIRSGTPVAGQVAVWVDANTIKGAAVYTPVPVAITSSTAADFSAAQAFTVAVAGAFTVANPSANPAVGTYVSITISMTAAGAVTWGANFKGFTNNYTQSTWVSGTMRDHLTFRWSGTTYDLIGVAKGINQ